VNPYRDTRPRSLPRRPTWLRIAWAVLTRGLRAKLHRRALRERWWRWSDQERSWFLANGPVSDAVIACGFVTRETHHLLLGARNGSMEVAFEAVARSSESEIDRLDAIPFVRVPDDVTKIVRT